jgi:glycosyltransferase involved in cell wall biosynthesis
MKLDAAIPFAVLIPAYKPSSSLVDVVRALVSRSFAAIVVVDDGSGPAYRETFETVAAMPGVRLVRHAVNLGKGAALKTGINYALCTFPGLVGLVTADADGQHHPDDIEAVAHKLAAEPDALVLGCRTFGGGVPLRSRIGNVATRGIMHALLGRKLTDTQTGLRGIPASLLVRLLKIEATGYEFELEMLIAAHQFQVPIVEVPIRTIYEAGNQSSHFNPVIDSMKIYFVLLRFGSVSLMTAVLDNLIYIAALHRTGNIVASVVLGRIFGLSFNYSMVRTSVFYTRQQHAATLPKYLALVLASGTAAYGGIRYLTAHAGMGPVTAKLLVETLLFFVNFAVQRLFIFQPQQNGGPIETVIRPAAENTPARLFPWLVGLVLAGGVAAEIYGFSVSKLFTQRIWDPVGLDRLVKFIGLFVAWGAAVLLVVPWTFAGLACGLALAVSAIAVGPLAVLAPAFFLISACALGSTLLGRAKDADLDTEIGATLLGTAVYLFLMSLIARLPVNFPAAWAGVLAVPILLDLRGTKRRLRRWAGLLASAELRRPAERAAFAFLVFVLAMHWLVVLKPEASADGLAMHLAIPANIAYYHRLTFEPARVLWSVMPMGADFTYSIVYLLGGEYASRLLDFAMLLAIVAMLYRAVRRWVTPAAAYLLAALFATTPIVQLVTGELFVENVLAALILGMMTAIWKLGETGERRYLYAAAALGGSALATKFGALAFVAVAIPFAVVEARRSRKLLGAGAAIAVLLFFAAALPPYATALIKTGNPLFPFLNEKFPSPVLARNADITDARFHQKLTWSAPYTMTFQTNDWYEGQNGAFGFQYLVFAPLALVAIFFVRSRPAVSAAVVALGASIFVLRSQPNARYIYAAMPLVTVPIAAVAGWIAPRQRVLYAALLAFCAASAAANIFFMAGSSYYHKDFYIQPLLSRARREEYLAYTAPIRGVIAHFNREHAGQAVLLPGGDGEIAGLHGDVYENHWHQFSTLDRIRHTQTRADMLRLIEEWKVRYFILRKPGRDTTIKPTALREVIESCTVAEFEYATYYEAKLLDSCGETVRPSIVVPRGAYDDADPAVALRGDWTRSSDFDGPSSYTVSFSDIPGSEASFAFDGHALTYVFTRAPNRGVAQVSIDGVVQGDVDLYSAAIEWQSRVRFCCFSPGKHVAAIRVTGKRGKAATGAFVDLDAFIVE